MVSKLATFRTDDETWESFQAKAKRNGTNASALLQRFVRDYLDDNLDSRIDSNAIPNLDSIDARIDERIDARIDAIRSEYDAKLDEAIALVKKPLMLSQNQKVIAIQKLQATA